MKPTRIKAPAIRTKAEFDATVDELARIEVELRKLTARQDARIQTIRAEFEPAITALQTQQEALALIAEKFAEENRDEIEEADGLGEAGEPVIGRLHRRLAQRMLALSS